MARATGAINQAVAGQQALLRAEEIAKAQGLLGGLTTSARGADIDIGKSDLERKLRTRALDIERERELISGALRGAGQTSETETRLTQLEEQEKQRRARFAGGLIQTGAQAFGLGAEK